MLAIGQQPPKIVKGFKATEFSGGTGSLRDVQQLAGHASLAMTQRYIEGDTEAKRKLVARV